MAVISPKVSSVASSPFTSPNIGVLLKIKIISWLDSLFSRFCCFIFDFALISNQGVYVLGARKLVCLFLFGFGLAIEPSTCIR